MRASHVGMSSPFWKRERHSAYTFSHATVAPLHSLIGILALLTAIPPHLMGTLEGLHDTSRVELISQLALYRFFS
jgi:hypothetical protein